MILTDESSQREARDYVLNRPITRPKTTVRAPVLLAICVIALGVVSGLMIAKFVNDHFEPSAFRSVMIVLGSVAIIVLHTMRWLLILCVKCYQHYASDNVRRSCLCKPTCSEYAIMVLKKHCLIKAVVLIHVRLRKTCTGKIYKIDFPDCCQTACVKRPTPKS